jgi:hypothetical protein
MVGESGDPKLVDRSIIIDLLAKHDECSDCKHGVQRRSHDHVPTIVATLNMFPPDTQLVREAKEKEALAKRGEKSEHAIMNEAVNTMCERTGLYPGLDFCHSGRSLDAQVTY